MGCGDLNLCHQSSCREIEMHKIFTFGADALCKTRPTRSRSRRSNRIQSGTHAANLYSNICFIGHCIVYQRTPTATQHSWWADFM